MLMLWFACSIAFLSIASAGIGQDFPTKPIRIIVGGAGSSADFVARLVAQGLSANTGQPAVVENRPSGVIPGETVSKAAPDGHTLLSAAGTQWIGPLLQKTPYDPIADFFTITLAGRAPNILVVHPSLPVKSVRDLIALAKARPGALNFATSGTGSTTHLAGELFKAQAGVNLTRINYKGAGAIINDLLGGQVDMMFGTSGSVIPHIKSGRLKALAVTSAEPSALLPGLPTIAATVPKYESVGMVGFFAPARTPEMVINRLNMEIVRILNQSDIKDKLLGVGIEPVGSTPKEFLNALTLEMTRLSKVIKDAGIRAD